MCFLLGFEEKEVPIKNNSNPEGNEPQRSKERDVGTTQGNTSSSTISMSVGAVLLLFAW